MPRHIAQADEPIIVPKLVDIRVLSLDKYFSDRECPLKPYADNFIQAADNNGIDWRLLAAISTSESTCGKHYPIRSNNPFGYLERKGSVETFDSIPSAINFITGQLANGKYYNGKTIAKKLSTYCPTPGYPEKTMGYMNQIYEK